MGSNITQVHRRERPVLIINAITAAGSDQGAPNRATLAVFRRSNRVYASRELTIMDILV